MRILLVTALAAVPAAPLAAVQDGIPVTNDLVIEACSECHEQDDDGRMSRISYMRKTPEGWQTSLRRMVMLNDAVVSAAEAREIVRYLSDEHGLAPEELRPGRFEVERRIIDWRYEADEETETTCKQCHSLGRVITQRRTKEEWELLLATHRGLYPFADFQAFRRGGPPGEGDDPRHPMDKAVAHLSSEFPLETDAWAAWSATKRPPRLSGTWLVSGHEPGRGPVFGVAQITADGTDPAQFTTSTRVWHPMSGGETARTGTGLVYTGYQWRGRSEGGSDTMREVMMVERDWRTITGRWFRGDYDEFEVNVTLTRVGGDLQVAGAYPRGLMAGRAQDITIYGANFPAQISSGEVDLGPGVDVGQVRRVNDNTLTVRVTVAEDAPIGTRDVFVGTASVSEGLVVYDEVSRVRVLPQAGMARVGGAAFPKGYQQYYAVAWHDGVDGEPDTDDDLKLGVVDVEWSLEEYSVTYDDDDLAFVGSLDDNGLFTPALDGPNLNRSLERNNIGDVWVVATLRRDDGTELRGRAHLLVTVPLYMRWEPWRVER